MSAYIRERLTTFNAATRRFGVSGPAIMGAALLDTAGYALGVFNTRSGMSEASEVADRPDMVVPEGWIEDIESVIDVDVLVRPLLDVLYQWHQSGVLPATQAGEQFPCWHAFLLTLKFFFRLGSSAALRPTSDAGHPPSVHRSPSRTQYRDLTNRKET